jgi:hypothetical protein
LLILGVKGAGCSQAGGGFAVFGEWQGVCGLLKLSRTLILWEWEIKTQIVLHRLAGSTWDTVRIQKQIMCMKTSFQKRP